jgi:hypothetical protein
MWGDEQGVFIFTVSDDQQSIDEIIMFIPADEDSPLFKCLIHWLPRDYAPVPIRSDGTFSGHCPERIAGVDSAECEFTGRFLTDTTASVTVKVMLCENKGGGFVHDGFEATTNSFWMDLPTPEPTP